MGGLIWHPNDHHFDKYKCEMCGSENYFWELKQVQVGGEYWETCPKCREKVERYIREKVIKHEKRRMETVG